MADGQKAFYILKNLDEIIIVAFEENGTGFLRCVSNNYSSVDKFNWNFDNGTISIKAIKSYLFNKDDIFDCVDDSIIADSTNIEVWTYETEALDGSAIKAIRFSQILDAAGGFEYGLECRDIWRGDFYSKLKDILQKY